ncbi:MAG: associated Golgi protein-related protein, partial [Edaphobacter sp.]|nr:associated Golgi protein-related protein [Edaphobacter sp.]
KAIFHRFHLGVELVLLAGIIWFVASHWKNRIKTEAA